jgi:tellurite methyltransferase
MMPPDRPRKVLVIGRGEGRNAVFFARNGYDVIAFDLSAKAVGKARRLAGRASVDVDVFQADVKEYRLSEEFDVLFSTGVLHYIPQGLRPEIVRNHKGFTSPSGLSVFSIFVKKPPVVRAPDGETTAQRWVSGELFTDYYDWRIEYCTEELLDCKSGGMPHQHAVNRMIARKPAD